MFISNGAWPHGCVTFRHFCLFTREASVSVKKRKKKNSEHKSSNDSSSGGRWPDDPWRMDEVRFGWLGWQGELGPKGKRQGSAEDVARWMLKELKKTGELFQNDAAEGIRRQFGGGFLNANPNSNAAIDKEVLEQFKKLTNTFVVWVRSDRNWRLREKGDPKGRMVD
jgi:hypothetical protein